MDRIKIILPIVLLLSACASTPAPTPTLTVEPSAPATGTASPIPTSTDTPAPTAIPGVQVIPIDSMSKSIPWLPRDKTRNPFSAYYGFNVRKPPFSSLLVRQAFAAAVDKDQVAREALGFQMREAVPATTLTPPAVLGRDLYGDIGIRFDPDRAKAFLQQAGYVTVEGFPHVTLLVYMRSSAAPGVHFRIAKTVAGMWKTYLGIEVEVVALENPPALAERMQSNPAEMYAFGWGADYIDPDNFLKALFHSESPQNYGHFNSPEFDVDVDRAAQLTDPAERQALYIQAERILTERETALIPLYHSLSYLPP